MSLQGTIFNIQHFSVNDGPGIRTTVFMKGCPLTCWWCHNPESRSQEILKVNGKTIGQLYSAEELFGILIKDRIFYDQSGGGVTFSGGEPLTQLAFLEEILIRCRENDIHTAVDTSGYADKKSIEKILPYTDLFLYDLKIIDPVDHLKYTSVSNKEIFENLEYIIEQETEVIIRIPLIPNITTTNENLESLIRYLKGFTTYPGVDLLPYHIIANGKYDKLKMKNLMTGIKELTKKEIDCIADQFVSSGIQVTIGGEHRISNTNNKQAVNH